MALKNVIGPADATRALAEWWQRNHPAARDVAVEDLEIPGSSGMSSETVLFCLRFVDDAGAHVRRLVARVIPNEGAVFPDYDFTLERVAMDAVRTTTLAPAPEVLLVEHDPAVLGAPFLLMERLDGRTLADDPPFTMAGWFMDLTVAERAAMFENALVALAQVHDADVSGFGPATLGHRDRAADGAVSQHLRHWEDFYEWSHAGRRHPTIEAALAWARANVPEEVSPPGLVWGDARLGNMMFGEGGAVTAVLDWEMAALGPAELDLGWFVFLNRMYAEGLGTPVPDGFLDRDQTVARYAEIADRPVVDFAFYEVLAGIRVSTVIMRIGNLMMEMGMMPADNPMPITNPASMVLASTLGLPTPGAASGWVSGHR